MENKTIKIRTPKAGETLDAYHDGKCSPSRLVRVFIDDVGEIERINDKYLRKWKRAINEDFNQSLFERVIVYLDGPQRFWDWNCGTFVFGHIVGDKDTMKDPIMFARRACGDEWYGVNWNYFLDATGGVRRKRLKMWKECAAEMGQTMKWNAKENRYDYFDKKTGKKVD